MVSLKILWLLSLVFLIKVTTCQRIHDQIYSSIEGGAACFRRLNGTHQAGCTSSLNGAVGVVHFVSNISEAQWMVHNGTAGPYMAIISTAVFNDVIEILMKEPANVAGILLYDNTTARPVAFSQESQCPNENSPSPNGMCAAGVVWNEKGSGLLRRDIPYPIFYLPESKISEITKIEECFNRYNTDKDNQKGRPLCSLQLSSFMYAAVNTAVCLRRSTSSLFATATKMCDPLGDYNVYYSLFPRTQDTATKKKPVILVTARMDSTSLFDGIAPGASSSVVGMVSLIVTAATLAQMIPVSDAALYNKNILFTLFNGESFDYIGSQRVAYDISKGSWPPVSPITSKDINLHVELGQLGGSLNLFKDSPSWPLYAYAPYNTVIPEISEFITEMSENYKSSEILPEFSVNIPPSSLHSFRKILSNVTLSGELPELLLVDHLGTFTNKYYESALDDYRSIGYNYHNISISGDGKFISTEELLADGTMTEKETQVKVARVATSLARALYQQVVGVAYNGTISSSAHLDLEPEHTSWFRPVTKKTPFVVSPLFGSTPLKASPSIGILDLDISSDCQFRGHLESKAKLASMKLGVINRARQYFNPGQRLALYKAQVDEMLYCFLRSQACRLLAAADYASADQDAPEDKPPSLYVGVASSDTSPAVYCGHLLALLAGLRAPATNRSDCDRDAPPGFSSYYLRGWNRSGVCIRTTMNFSQAISPAFTKSGYDLSSSEFSSWSESVWAGMWARVFVGAGGAGAGAAAGGGALATALAAAATYWLRTHAARVFLHPPSERGIIRSVNC